MRVCQIGSLPTPLVRRPIGVSLAQNGMSPQVHDLKASQAVHHHRRLLHGCDVEVGQRECGGAFRRLRPEIR